MRNLLGTMMSLLYLTPAIAGYGGMAYLDDPSDGGSGGGGLLAPLICIGGAFYFVKNTKLGRATEDYCGPVWSVVFSAIAILILLSIFLAAVRKWG